ncbi:MAG: polysaccharide deacetylase, partial [Coprobacillus sp.]
YQYYDWNASSGDAGGNNVAVANLVRNSTSSHASNIMLLCHDTAAKSTTVQALPQIIEHYQSLGYTFKGISDRSYSPHQHINN